MKLNARLIPISTRIPRLSICSRLETTNQAPNSPKIAPLAPSASSFCGAIRKNSDAAAERAEQVDGDEAAPAEQLLQARARPPRAPTG